MSENGPRGLQRAIGPKHATAMVVGTIIGASIFVQPSEITGQVPTVVGIYAVWLVCGVLTLFGALVCAELASAFPQAGGVYVYLREAFSPAVGFLWGWAMFWTMHSGIVAVIAVVCARYLGFFVELSDLGQRVVAVGTILLLSAVNYVGVKHGSILQTAITAGKLLAIGTIVILCFLFGGSANEVVVEASRTAAPGSYTAQDFGLALVAGLFAFGGWHMVTYNAEETKEPRTTIPKALVLGTLVVTACYILLNAVYLYVLPMETVASSDRVAADAADAVFGRGGGAAMSALVVFSAFGALSGIVLAGPRVYFAMARDGLVFNWFGAVHQKYGTPHRAIVLQAIWASVLALTGTYRSLFTRVIYTEWIFFGMMALGLIVLRKRPGVTRDYEIWGYPWVPIIFAISAFGIVGNQLLTEPLVESLTGLGLVLVGWPVYMLWARKTVDQ
ncbi:MAG TPA: amino acid permease [Gemmatimonadetes bacterium]|nr:amino acid permease [Gemmatimonadota bacterium]HIB08878.1 amino acid permease [Gemmatimonadota bacterium]